MNVLRTTSTRRLIAGSVLSVAIVAAGVAAAMAAGGGGTPPPAKPLATAIHDALAAPAPTAITARVHFTNNLITTGAVSLGSPLLTGADGRLWLSGDRLRLELQSDAGDAQISVADGHISIYDASSNTVYKATVPAGQTPGSDTGQGAPAIAEISSALAQLAQETTLSGAQPTTKAGQPAYQLSVTPKHDAGLLGQAEIAWDADNGVPLHLSLAAAGSSSPVLALDVTDISFGSVDSSALSITSPASAKVVDLGSLAHSGHSGSGTGSETTGVAAVSSAVPFALAAPPTLVGLPRTGVRLISVGDDPAALVTYGKGLGVIALVERATPKPGQGSGPLGSLPSVSIDGATGHELPTALGTLVTVERGGVGYTLLGSLPPNAAEAALRAVLA